MHQRSGAVIALGSAADEGRATFTRGLLHFDSEAAIAVHELSLEREGQQQYVAVCSSMQWDVHVYVY